jgi:uncharacterized membrane protein YqjE
VSKTSEQDPDPVQEAVKRLPSELRLILEKRLELLALDVGEGVSLMFAKLFFAILGILLLGLAVLLGMFSLALYLSDVLDNEALGYLLTALPLLLFGVLLVNKRPKMLYIAIQNRFLKQFVDVLSKKNTL